MIQNSIYPPRKTALLLGAIVVLGSLIRIAIATNERLWIDELHTSWAVDSSLDDVAFRAHAGNQPPAFFWLTWLSVNTFGHCEFTLRLVSLLAGVGLIAIAAWITWQWTHSSMAASIVAWLIAVDFTPATTSVPIFLWNATEARPYAMIQLLSLLQVASFWLWIRECFLSDPPITNNETANRRDEFRPRLFLVAVSVAMIYTSFTCVWIFIIELLFLAAYSLNTIIRQRNGHRLGRVWQQALINGILVFLFAIPAILKMSTVFSRRGNWQSISSLSTLWLDQAIPKIIWISIPIAVAALIRFSATMINSRRGNANQDESTQIGRTIGCHSNQTRDDAAESAQNSSLSFSIRNIKTARLILVLFWLLGPLLIVTMLAWFQIAPVAHHRYTLVGSTAAPMLLGLVVGGITSSKGRIALAAMIIAMGAVYHPVIESAIWNHSLVTFRDEDWKTAISELNTNDNKRTHPVFLFSNLVEDVAAHENMSADFQNYLRFPVRGLYRIEESSRDISPGPTLAMTHFKFDQVNLAAEQGGAWIFVRDDPENPTLAIEIANELHDKLVQRLGLQDKQITIRWFSTQASPVYLISVDW